jgi:hypothetical protein
MCLGGLWRLLALFALVFHILSPIPHLIAKAAISACHELAYFFMTGIAVSALGFSVILVQVAVIQCKACDLLLAGNAVIFLTIQDFFLIFGRGDDFSKELWQ